MRHPLHPAAWPARWLCALSSAAPPPCGVRLCAFSVASALRLALSGVALRDELHVGRPERSVALLGGWQSFARSIVLQKLPKLVTMLLDEQRNADNCAYRLPPRPPFSLRARPRRRELNGLWLLGGRRRGRAGDEVVQSPRIQLVMLPSPAPDLSKLVFCQHGSAVQYTYSTHTHKRRGYIGEEPGKPSNPEATTARKRPPDDPRFGRKQVGAAGDSGMEGR